MEICVINHPASFNRTPIDNLLEILKSITSDVHCIFGAYEFEHYVHDEALRCHQVTNTIHSNRFLRILNYLTLQVRLTKVLYMLKNDVNICLFFIGGDTLLFPILLLRLLGKQVVLVLAGSSIKTHSMNKDKLTIGLKILRSPCLSLSQIILLSTHLH
jgi:hypothetical protein